MFNENEKLLYVKDGKEINCKYREPYGEYNSLIYLYTKDWRCYGDKLVSNIFLKKIEEELK